MKRGKHGQMQDKIYDFIVCYIKEHRYSPSFRDIANGVGLKSLSTVFFHMRKLRDQGKITFVDKISRSIVITEAEDA